MKFIETEEYKRFTDKFKANKTHVKTTDDCYTLEEVYEVVFSHCVETYGIDPEKVVRPFYPGGDYKKHDYSGGKVVIDNPPFSISSEIIDFYLENKIPFFLFANGKTIYRLSNKDVRIVVIWKTVIFNNGASVCIGFVTNLNESGIEYNSNLGKEIERVRGEKRKKRTLRKYPENILCLGNYHSKLKGKDLFIPKKNLTFTQKTGNIRIYGGGLILDNEGLAIVKNAVKDE